MQISDEAFSALLLAYDEFDSAAGSMLTAQPGQMTAAAKRLEAAKVVMWAAVQGAVRTMQKEEGNG